MVTIQKIMSEVQTFASAWALVGGRFDDGGALDQAEQCRGNLRDMITAALGEPPGSADVLALARRYGAACASTARTPPNSPARHAAAGLENTAWRELEAALRAAVVERDQMKAQIEAIEAQEPTAVIGSGYGIRYVGAEPISAIVERHGLGVGALLYARPIAARAEPHGWRALLTEARDLFVMYAESHRARGPEHAGKAVRNEGMATKITAALAANNLEVRRG